MGKDDDTVLPKQKRGCTDFICFIVFIAFWLGMFAVGALAFTGGDLNRVKNGYDYQGRTCGGTGKNPLTEKDYDLTNHNRLWYPYPWLIDDSGESQKVLGPKLSDGSEYKIKYSYGVCVKECPGAPNAKNPTDKSSIICNYGDTGEAETCGLKDTGVISVPTPTCSLIDMAADDCDDDAPFSKDDAPEKPGAYLKYESNDKKGKSLRCVPGSKDGKDSKSMISIKKLFDKILESADKLSAMIEKIGTNWPYILTSAFLALIMGFAYLWFLKLAGKAMVWVTIIGVIVFTGACAAMAWTKSGLVTPPASDKYTAPDPAAKDEQTLWMVAAAIASVCFIAILFVVIVLAKRINEAVKVMNLTTKAFSDMPAILFFPAIMWVAIIALTAWFVAVLTFQMTAGDFNKLEFKYEWNQDMKRMAAYNFFGFLWTKAFMGSMGDLTVAMAVATWYFAADKKADSVKGAVFGSFRKALRYHVGTVAVGSFIIAVVQFIRAMVNLYLKQAEAHKNNKIIKLLACCFNYCMAYVERVLKFLNRNAYIQTAIHGTSFFVSAKNAVVLLGKNFLRLAAITMVSGVFIFLGKLVIALGTTFICYMVMEQTTGAADPLTILVILLLSMSIASVFMNIYNMGIDAMFQCFCTKPELAGDDMKDMGKDFDKSDDKEMA